MGLVAMLCCASVARAHEIIPMVGDMEIGDQLTLRLEGAVEPLLAGQDLTGLTRTEEADNPDLEALQRLPAAALEKRVQEIAPGLLASLKLSADGVALVPVLTAVEAGPMIDPELPRMTRLDVTAALPADVQSVHIEWPAGYGELVLRQTGVEHPYNGLLIGGMQADLAKDGQVPMTAWQALLHYIPVGIDHIVPLGLDHILFVLGLFFFATNWRLLLLQVTAFTLAHTITLALAALRIFSLPADIVEPLIAASITFVALENIWGRHDTKLRLAVIFGFGLLHGMGFASVLRDFGVAEGQLVPSLIGFNVGVELGQLIVIAAALLVTGSALALDHADEPPRKSTRLAYGFAAVVLLPLIAQTEGVSQLTVIAAIGGCILCAASLTPTMAQGLYRSRVAIPASAIIALIGAWWVIERVFLGG